MNLVKTAEEYLHEARQLAARFEAGAPDQEFRLAFTVGALTSYIASCLQRIDTMNQQLRDIENERNQKTLNQQCEVELSENFIAHQKPNY